MAIGSTNSSNNTKLEEDIKVLQGKDVELENALSGKASSNHTHSYAGSSSVGGAATSANKLNTSAGSATNPVYFSNGLPVAGTYSLNKTVPSDAVFTDTTYTVAISMASLGYKGATCTVHEFFTALRSKGYSGNICVDFIYNNANAGNVSDGTTTAIMNGTACFISTSSNGTWRKDYALVNNSTKTYLFYAVYDGNTTPSTQKIVDLTLNTWRGIQNNLTSTSTSDSLSAYQGKVLNDNKSDKNHTHNYAGSSSAGGAANSLSYFQNTSSSNMGQDTCNSNAIGYVTDYSGSALTSNVKDGALYRQAYSTSWAHEIYGDYRTGQIAVRGKNNGTWQSWRRILDESNYTSYAVTKSGNSTVNGAITFGNNDSYGIRTSNNNYGRIGESGKAFYQSYINNMYGTLQGTANGPISSSSLFTQKFTFSVSAITGGSDSAQALSFTTPTGCTALGIVGKYMSGNYYTYLVFTSEYVSGNSIQTMIHNSASVTTGTISLTYIILFCKR